jgi:hypothetical protein
MLNVFYSLINTRSYNFPVIASLYIFYSMFIAVVLIDCVDSCNQSFD